jgi:hypothetical protein
MKTAFKILTGIWAVICLIMMLYVASKGKTDYTICWGVFSIWSLMAFYKYFEK